MLKRLMAIAVFVAACFLLGCDVMEQDIEISPHCGPPGEEDQENEAQTQ